MTPFEAPLAAPAAARSAGGYLHVPDHLTFEAAAAAPRPLYLEEFGDGSGFVFDPESPRGVTYLSRHAFPVYRGLLTSDLQRPVVDELNGGLYRDFVRSGIALPHAQPLVATPRRAPDRQFSVWFHISNACNLSCRYCYIPKLDKAVDLESMGAQFMSPSTIELATRSLMDFCRAEGFRRLNIKFAGGEPTLDVPKLATTCELALRLAEASGIELTFSMLSNGVFVDDAIFGLIETHKIAVAISIDGARGAHDRVRFTIGRSRTSGSRDKERRGTWDTIARNIPLLKAIGSSPYVLCTVTEDNFETLRALLDDTIAWGVGTRLSLVRDRRSHLKPGLAERMLAELIALYEGLGRTMPTAMPIDPYAAFAEWKPAMKKVGVCGSCRSSAALDQNGNVASCQMRMNEPFGSAREEAFGSIFERMRAADDNRYLADPAGRTGDCASCYWRYTCAGGCPEHSRMALGSLNAPSPWCGLYRGLLPTYLRAIATQMKRRSEPALVLA